MANLSTGFYFEEPNLFTLLSTTDSMIFLIGVLNRPSDTFTCKKFQMILNF